jgi:hypothetical protein
LGGREAGKTKHHLARAGAEEGGGLGGRGGGKPTRGAEMAEERRGRCLGFSVVDWWLAVLGLLLYVFSNLNRAGRWEDGNGMLLVR